MQPRSHVLILCGINLHDWFREGDRRTCSRCRQIETLGKNIHGDENWEVESKGADSKRNFWIFAGAFGWASAAVMLVLLLTGTGTTDDGSSKDLSQFEFAGRLWTAKSNQQLLGPGPNFFSSTNVNVDPSGRLHLEIREINGRWSAAEVISETSLGYGAYRFTIGDMPDVLDDNVVFAFLTWDDAPAQNHREMDIELRRREIDGTEYPGAFTVQPWDEQGNTQNIKTSPNTGYQYSFHWAPDGVEFSIRDTEDNLLESWKYIGPLVPDPGNEKVRINLWLAGGRPPADLMPVEVVVENFTFQLLP